MNKQKDIIIFIVVAALLIGLGVLIKTKSGYAPVISTDGQKDTRLQITTSFYPLYFFATEIGGDKARVINIIPAGVEPHEYEPSAKNIMEIENSRLLILNGGGLEAWGDKLARIINSSETSILTVGKDIATRASFEDRRTLDPHIWLSPPLAKIMVEKIKTAFVQADPEHVAYYEENAALLTSKLNDLDTSFQKGLASCAERNIITSHTAFAYLAEAYQLKQVSIAGLSPEAEPSPRQLADIIQFAKNNNVKYIFLESLASPKLSEMIAREVGAKLLVLNPIEGLTPSETAAGEDYFTVMRKNLANLEMALGCQK